MSPNKTKSHSLHRKGGKLRPKHHCATPTPSSPDKQRGKASLQSIVYAKPSYVDQLSLSSTSWCLYDENVNKFLGFREKNKREIASLTKIMTTIVSIEFFEKWEINEDLYVKVTEASSKLNGTSAGLKFNSWIRVWDLLYGTMLPSGNDAAHLLSETIGYLSKKQKKEVSLLNYLDLTQESTILYTSVFVKMMNKKAEELKLDDTTFSNPHGLQNAMNTSSPKDMLRLCVYATKNLTFRKIMNTETLRFSYFEESKPGDESQNHIKEIEGNSTIVKKKRWWNTNMLLKKGWEGVKTGQTGAAGSCLASLKNKIFIVILHCKDNEARFTETEKIYNWYIAQKSFPESLQNNESLQLYKTIPRHQSQIIE